MSDALSPSPSAGRDAKTRLSYWFPKIQAAGLPVPRTEIIQHPYPLSALLDGETPPLFNELLASLRASASRIGLPCFLRTGYTSGKHDWSRTCYVTDVAKIGQHVANLVEFSDMADILGLPTDEWVVREMLMTSPAFVAFRGMPITQEFRYFVRDGAIEHVQPYWPPGAIEGHTTDPAWREKLAAMSEMVPWHQKRMNELAVAASAAVGGGYWSVDFLYTINRGWVLTDMAEGDKSYRWTPPCRTPAV